MTRRPRLATAIFAGLLVWAPVSRALAWGATGHRLIGQLATQALPPDLPAFLRSPNAAKAIGELSREPDRWKAAGRIHDTDRDPAHFVDIDDAGKVMGGPALAALPATREDYETALRAVGSDAGRAGYLPYSIVDDWQQVAKDLAYWRVLTLAIPRETDPARKAWLQDDLARREALTLRDIGEFSHYVGDGSQPMHVSVHYNGWGPYPNPNGYTQDRVHAYFEGAFVRANVTAEAVRAAMPAPVACAEPIETCVARYLGATVASVEPFYVLQKAGAFAGSDPVRGRAFAAERLAAGAAELRDLIVSAWAASARGSVGYPPVSVDQAARGADPYDALFGED